MRLLLASVMMFFASTAMASSFTIQWDDPVQRVNGDPLLAEEIAGYDLRCYAVSENPVENIQYYSVSIPPRVENPDGEFTVKMSDIFPDYGSYNCELAVVDTDGISSDYAFMSNGPVDYAPSKPQAPTNVIILVN